MKMMNKKDWCVIHANIIQNPNNYYKLSKYLKKEYEKYLKKYYK